MTNSKEATGNVEWRIRVPDGSCGTLAPQTSTIYRPWLFLKCLITSSFVWRFLEKAWNVAVDDPRKAIHGLKVGIALSFVSLFYYMRPLYDGVGGTAMWALMTVVVAFEYTVGATLSKCLNRVTGTFLAGFLAVGIHWVAGQSGEKLEPIIRDISIFLLVSLATFSRFIPAVKARFDYGALIFILTFSLVSVASYRVEKLFEMARERLVTVVIGTSFCILINMLLVPIWAGEELHVLITSNMNKIANSLDSCVADYFDGCDETSTRSDSAKNLLAYRCVLNSKATEEAMANFARWEPAHGLFKFQHPWKQYLKLGASMRNCAYCIEALNICINNKKQASESIKNHLSETCQNLSSSISAILGEIAENVKTMNRPYKMDILVEEMNSAVKELQYYLNYLPGFSILPPASETKSAENENNPVSKTTDSESLLLIIPLATFASLLIKTAARVEDIVDAVQELAEMAEFKPEAAEKSKQNQSNCKIVAPDQQKHEETMKSLQRV